MACGKTVQPQTRDSSFTDAKASPTKLIMWTGSRWYRLTSSCCLSGRLASPVKLVITSFSALSRRYCCLGFSAWITAKKDVRIP